MATTYKKLKYDNSECAVQYAYEAGKATCDSNGKEISSTYYDLSKNINVAQGNDLLNYSGIEIGSTGNDIRKSKKYVVKAINDTSLTSRFMEIYRSFTTTTNGANLGTVHIYGTIGPWNSVFGYTNVDITIGVREYNNTFYGTIYSYGKGNVSTDMVEIYVGILSSGKLSVVLQFKQDYVFAMLNVDSIANCQNLTLSSYSSITFTTATTLSAQISAGNVKNLLA